MGNIWVILGGISGALAVGAGAFGAHGLRSRLAPDMLAVFETGSRYQMYHAVALVLVGLLATRTQAASVTVAGWAFLAGTVVFSGSLYALALSGIRALGAITPLGGLAFIVGWLAIALAGWQIRGG